MKLKVYINDKYYRTIDSGDKNSDTTYDPSIVMQYINKDLAEGLLGSFDVDTKGIGIKVEPAN